MNQTIYNTYLQILKDELLPAMGCTEPIAIAYAGAIARKALGNLPTKVVIQVSRNIIKNVKSVIVPHTGGLRGIEAACAIGIVAGKPDCELEVISQVTQQQIDQTKTYLQSTPIMVELAQTNHIFDIIVHLYHQQDTATVRIVDYHTNVVQIEHNGTTLLSKEITGKSQSTLTDKSLLSVQGILEFAQTVQISDVQPLLERQISYNMTIAKEGIKNNYGANIGKVLLQTYGEQDVKVRAKAYAAAASDARMNGCELPVVINSGSGNQGITASVPVTIYAQELNASQEQLYRALVISNLCTLHIKEGIGRLSAYCGVIGAGCGAGAGIAYLHGADYDQIAHTLVNSLAILSGTICDGAKASCAAKIASSVDAGILGYFMYRNNQQFVSGDGIVKGDVEQTIRCIGLLASQGMQETDKEIVKLMIQPNC